MTLTQNLTRIFKFCIPIAVWASLKSGGTINLCEIIYNVFGLWSRILIVHVSLWFYGRVYETLSKTRWSSQKLNQHEVASVVLVLWIP